MNMAFSQIAPMHSKDIFMKDECTKFYNASTERLPVRGLLAFWLDCWSQTIPLQVVMTDSKLLFWLQEVRLWTGSSSKPAVEGIGPASTEILTEYNKLREVRQHYDPFLSLHDMNLQTLKPSTRACLTSAIVTTMMLGLLRTHLLGLSSCPQRALIG